MNRAARARHLKSLAFRFVSSGRSLPLRRIERFVEMHLLKRLIGLLGINCVLDVGANNGGFATELRNIGYSGRIVSFEPIAEEFDALTRSFAGDPNWRGVPLALGSREEMATLHVPPAATGMSSFLDQTLPSPNMSSRPVQIVRLDSLYPSLVADMASPRVLLKMDTQGYDLEVFRGAGDCIDGIAALQSELSSQPLYHGMPHYLEALQVYETAGFELYNLTQMNRARNGTVVEMNCLMKRP
ncbi:MAG: FkbM family methyltransferase [Sphingomonadales bacterium]